MPIHYNKSGSSYAVGNCCAFGSLEGMCRDSLFVVNNPLFQKPLKNKRLTTKTLRDQPEYLEQVADIEAACSDAIKKGKSMVLATVNTRQRISAAILEDCGFVAMSKDWAYRHKRYGGASTGVKAYIKILMDNSDVMSHGYVPEPKAKK